MLPSPQSLGLPYAEWRSQQAYALRKVGRVRTKYLVFQIPTGGGKSGVAVGIGGMGLGRVVTLTATKALQDQYASSTPLLYDLRGMGNYECLAAHDEFARYFPSQRFVSCSQGPCRSQLTCSLKEDGCIYFDTRREALRRPSMLTSYAKWCADRRYGTGLGVASVLVCDEAHAISEELMGARRIEIPYRALSGKVPRSLGRWREWATAALREVQNSTEDVTTKLRRRPLADNLEALTTIDEATWAMEDSGYGFAFEPVVPSALLPSLCDNLNRTVVFLSATVTPESLYLLGIQPEDVTFVEFPSTFPVGSRPVYLLKTCRVDSRMTTTDRGWWLHQIDAILSRRTDRKGIIHTVSFDRMWEVLKGSKHSGRLLADDRRARTLAETLVRFRADRGAAVLVSPSLMTGHDFPLTDAEFQIIGKVPFPDTRSPIAKARMQHNAQYRAHVTAQNLVQMAGRINRNEEDSGETFIVDDHARWVLGQYGAFISGWFTEAVQWVDKVPPALPKLKAA